MSTARKGKATSSSEKSVNPKRTKRTVSEQVRPELSPPTQRRPGYPEETDEERSPSPPTKKTRPEYPEETDEGPDSLMVLSEERINIAVDYMNSHLAGLLQSPPYTGKTSFGLKLRDHLLDLNENAIYISLAGLAGKKARYEETEFNTFWKKKTGRTWTDILDCETPTKVIVDEAQVIYGDCAPFFWGSIKDHISTKLNDNLRVLLVATYSLDLMPTGITPIVFHDPLGLDVLRLTEAEFEELVNMYVQKKQAQHQTEKFKIEKKVREVIYSFTHGHAGICRSTLMSLRQMFADGASAKDMLQYLASSRFLFDLSGTRALNWVYKWQPTTEEANFLRYALCNCDSDSSFDAPFEYSQLVEDFSKIGIIIRTSEHIYQFTAPIMRIIMSHRLFTAPTYLPRTPSDTFDEFLNRSIERMRPSTLRESFGKGVGNRLLERTWQMEWYRTAKSAAPQNAIISPDVGRIFGSDGFLDFYVDGNLSWGVELTREGSDLKEDGIYSNITTKEWVVIDFWHHSKDVREIRSNIWHVLYQDDYKSVTVLRKHHKPYTLTLVGDEYAERS